jgi:membrane protein DedA with SNARE-associated domain
MTADPLPLLFALACVASLLGCRVAYVCGRGAEADRWAAAAGGGAVRHRGREYVVMTAREFGRPVLAYRNHNLKR